MDNKQVNFTEEEKTILRTFGWIIILVFFNLFIKLFISGDDWYTPHLVNWITIFTGVAVCYSTYTKIRRTRYANETGGRNFEDDRKKYHRTAEEMSEFFLTSDLHELNVETFPVRSWKNTEGIILGDANGHLISLPSNTEANLFAAGTPGSGKTTGLVIPSCLRFGGSVLAVDIKGDIFNTCRETRKILRFCPDLKDKNGNSLALKESAHFNPFSGINEMDQTERKLFLTNLASTLIPEQPGSDASYFVSTARKMLVGITTYLLTVKPDVSFPEVLHAILHHQAPDGITLEHFPSNIFQWVEMIAESSITSAVEQVSSLLGNNEKNVSGAYDTLCSALIPFSNDILDVLLTGPDNCISVSTLENGNDVYLQISQENLDAYSPLMTMILQTFMTGFSKRPDTSSGVKNRPFLVLLDEFPQLTFSYGMINNALSTLRSKSIQCMLIAQTVSQLSRKYPQEGWRVLLGNCTYQMVLKSNDILTQQYFSNLFGTHKDLKISTSGEMLELHSPRTVSEERIPIFQPEDFGDLGDNLVIYYNGKYIVAKKIKSYQ